MPSSKNYKRDYKEEYENYHASPKQKKDRASRNAARRKMIKNGKVKKGDNKDVHHVNGNVRDNTQLAVKKQSKNRSFPRTKTARKRNKND